MSTTIDLGGRWEIVSWEQQYDDGRRELPMGEHLEGFIQYGADGTMACMIARAERSNFASGGQWNAPDAEKARAYDSMLSYAGRYRIADDVVTHSVELSLYPNWKGGEQPRRFALQADGTLALTARLEHGTPQARTSRLVWQRPHATGKTQGLAA